MHIAALLFSSSLEPHRELFSRNSSQDTLLCSLLLLFDTLSLHLALPPLLPGPHTAPHLLHLLVYFIPLDSTLLLADSSLLYSTSTLSLLYPSLLSPNFSFLFRYYFPTANLLGFNLWGQGLVTGKCTPRKTGAVLERCWNRSLLGCKAGLMLSYLRSYLFYSCVSLQSLSIALLLPQSARPDP